MVRRKSFGVSVVAVGSGGVIDNWYGGGSVIGSAR